MWRSPSASISSIMDPRCNSLPVCQQAYHGILMMLMMLATSSADHQHHGCCEESLRELLDMSDMRLVLDLTWLHGMPDRKCLEGSLSIAGASALL